MGWMPDWFWDGLEPVKNRYTIENPPRKNPMTVADFKEVAKDQGFDDTQGYGLASNGTHYIPGLMILPSGLDKIPEDATHILFCEWFT